WRHPRPAPNAELPKNRRREDYKTRFFVFWPRSILYIIGPMLTKPFIHAHSSIGTGSNYNSQASAVLCKFNATGFVNQGSWNLFVNTDGRAAFFICTDGNHPSSTVYSTNLCPFNTWTHLAATYDGVQLQIYFNGLLEGTVFQSGNIFPGRDDLGIGAKLGGVA